MKRYLAHKVFMVGYWIIYLSSMIDEGMCLELLNEVYKHLRGEGALLSEKEN